MAISEYRPQDTLSSKSASSTKASAIKKPLTAEERLQESQQRYIKIMSATMKAQTPDEPAKSGDMAQLFASMESTSASLKSVGLLEKIHASLSSHEMTKALPFHGKQVQYNTSIKQFDGERPVDFQYQLKYNDQSRPSGAHISTMITILDSKGLKVLQAKGETKNGVHNFKWDGRNSRGKLLDEGEYSIKVEANWERIVDGVLEKTPIEAGAFISGSVDSVEMRGGKVKLIIDGVAIDIDDVIKIQDDGAKTQELKIADYSGYIGQSAEVDNNDLIVDAKGFASIDYKCSLERPGKLSVQIFNDRDELVGVAVIGDVRKGLNNIKFKASNALTEEDAEKFAAGDASFSPLSQGEYKYKLSIQDRLYVDPEKYTSVPTARSIIITGLDFAGDPVALAGEERFSIDKITRLGAVSGSSDVFKEAVQYLGKYADISLNQLELKNGAADAQFFKIPVFEGEGYYGVAYLEIFDDTGMQVASIEKDPRAMIIDDGSGAYYNKDNLFNFLAPAAKEIICNSFGLDDVDNIDEVAAELTGHGRIDRLPELKNDVVQGLGDATLELNYAALHRGYADLSEIDQALVKRAIDENKRYTGFQWDGKGLDGKKLANGSYKYELRIEKYHTRPDTAAEILELELVPSRESVKIEEYTAENGDLKFIGRRYAAGGATYGDAIIFSRDEIVKLSA